jgi:hypothetical protein
LFAASRLDETAFVGRVARRRRATLAGFEVVVATIAALLKRVPLQNRAPRIDPSIQVLGHFAIVPGVATGRA